MTICVIGEKSKPRETGSGGWLAGWLGCQWLGGSVRSLGCGTGAGPPAATGRSTLCLLACSHRARLQPCLFAGARTAPPVFRPALLDLEGHRPGPDLPLPLPVLGRALRPVARAGGDYRGADGAQGVLPWGGRVGAGAALGALSLLRPLAGMRTHTHTRTHSLPPSLSLSLSLSLFRSKPRASSASAWTAPTRWVAAGCAW